MFDKKQSQSFITLDNVETDKARRVDNDSYVYTLLNKLIF